MPRILAYITTPDEKTARDIARKVVEERLAACANILPGMVSVYRWQGKTEEGAETVLLFKTRAELFEKLEARVAELHPYDVPCIVALPITAGHGAFLEWVETETGG